MNYNPLLHTSKKSVQLMTTLLEQAKKWCSGTDDVAGLMTWRWWEWVN